MSQKNTKNSDTVVDPSTQLIQENTIPEETTPVISEPVFVTDGTYVVDVNTSTINWLGKSPVKKHDGMLKLKSGNLNVVNGELSGNLTFDMNSISSDVGEALDNHLKSADFFDVTTYPEATLEVLGYAHGMVSGNLTLHGTTQSVAFPATLEQQIDGSLVVNSQASFDRTQWGIVYNSGTLLSDLGDKAIDDTITLDVKISAQTESPEVAQ